MTICGKFTGCIPVLYIMSPQFPPILPTFIFLTISSRIAANLVRPPPLTQWLRRRDNVHAAVRPQRQEDQEQGQGQHPR